MLYDMHYNYNGYYGTFRGDLSIFKTLMLTHKYMNSDSLVQSEEGVSVHPPEINF